MALGKSDAPSTRTRARMATSERPAGSKVAVVVDIVNTIVAFAVGQRSTSCAVLPPPSPAPAESVPAPNRRGSVIPRHVRRQLASAVNHRQDFDLCPPHSIDDPIRMLQQFPDGF